MQEDKVFKDLVLSDTSKGLVHVFFAQRAASKVKNLYEHPLFPKSIPLFLFLFISY